MANKGRGRKLWIDLRLVDGRRAERRLKVERKILVFLEAESRYVLAHDDQKRFSGCRVDEASIRESLQPRIVIAFNASDHFHFLAPR
jgi:hypothetical protein